MSDLVLLSGGLDSAVMAARSREAGMLGPLLFVDYGQPALREELRAAAIIATWLDRELVSTKAPLPTVCGLSDGRHGVVGGRNLALVAHGVAWAVARGCGRVLIGATADDVGGYPDCRPEWVAAADSMCLAAYGVGVVAPLAHLRKRQVMTEAARLQVPVGSTWTCYTPTMGEPCGACAACGRRAAL